MIKKIDNYFFYENINHYTNAMTGHSINTQQNQEFLSTMHTMIDDLDTISPNIDEHTYLRLVNGLQRLYNIHNSTTQTSSTNNRETWAREQRQIFNEENITTALARHYGRVYDSSGILIHNDIATINDHAYPVNADAYPVNADYDSWNENNPLQNRDSASANANASASARISYTSVTSTHWIEAALREGLRSAH
jgi:hypothetical protein